MKINVNELIYPLFTRKGKKLKEEIPQMEGVFRMSPDVILDEVKKLKELGIKNILIFGIPEKKDPEGSESYSDNNAVNESIRLIRDNKVDITIFTDVCLCAYISHGHCGIIHSRTEGIDNKATLKALSLSALSHAKAGADYVAPSAMAEGQVGAVRKVLDEKGFKDIKIMGYSAKFASVAYGPFRNIADSAPEFGDRTGYQLDHTDAGEALRKIYEDVKQGADIVMVKPALWYLDIISKAKAQVQVPLAVYNVSGEYFMVKEGTRKKMWDEKSIVEEMIHSFKRAGADLIITYHAKDIARWKK